MVIVPATAVGGGASVTAATPGGGCSGGVGAPSVIAATPGGGCTGGLGGVGTRRSGAIVTVGGFKASHAVFFLCCTEFGCRPYACF